MSLPTRAPAAPAAVTVDAPFAQALAEIATRRPDVAVLAADLSKYTDVSGLRGSLPGTLRADRHG